MVPSELFIGALIAMNYIHLIHFDMKGELHMFERKLASIQVISELHPIMNADAIEVAKVLGWYAVIKKDEGFKAGDKVIYIEVDSVLPEIDTFSFMAPYHYRVRTIKLRGQVSQGLVLPMSLLPEGEYPVGMDVSTILDIKQYDPPIPVDMVGIMKGPFPGFLPHTGETRAQSIPEILKKYKGVMCHATEKIDGTSITIYRHNDDYGVCSMNMEFMPGENPYCKTAMKYGLPNSLKRGYNKICLQAEMYGSGIQKNRYDLPPGERRLAFFNYFNIQSYSYSDLEALKSQLRSLQGSVPAIRSTTPGAPYIKPPLLETVPIVHTDFELPDDINELVAMAKGPSMINPKIQREGIVIRPVHEIVDPAFGRLSFKVLNPDYLLKYDE